MMRAILSILALGLLASQPASASSNVKCHFEADLLAAPKETRGHPDGHSDEGWLILEVSVVKPSTRAPGLRYCRTSVGPRTFTTGDTHRIKVLAEPAARAMSRGTRARFLYEYGDFLSVDRGVVVYEDWKLIEILRPGSPPPDKALQGSGE